MKIDSNKIAQMAKVSRSTVSRVLNNHPNVSEKNRERILKIIEEYNYTPNLNAQTLAGKKNKVIGLFIYAPNMINKYNNTDTAYFMNFIDTIIREAFLKNHQVLVDYIKDTNDEKRIEGFFKNGNVSSGLFIGFSMNNIFINKMIKSDHKIVVVDYSKNIDEKAKNTFYINTDDYLGAFQVMEKIIGKNLKRTLFFAGDVEKLSSLEREKAYLDSLKKYNISLDKDLIINSNYCKEKAYLDMKNFLKKNIKFDSIFASNDNMLYGVIKALKDENIDYQNIEIWGFDNLKYTLPMGLKSVSPMLVDTAKKSIDFLIINSQSNKIHLTKPKLIEDLNTYFKY